MKTGGQDATRTKFRMKTSTVMLPLSYIELEPLKQIYERVIIIPNDFFACENNLKM